MNKRKIISINDEYIKESIVTKIFRIPEIGTLIPVLFLLLIVISIKSSFLSPNNLGSLARGTAFNGIIAIGIAYALIAGQIDLSVGAVAGFGAITSAIFMVKMGFQIWSGLLLSLIICAFIGLINGLLAIKIKIPSFIATLGTMFAIRGLNLVITGGRAIYPLPEPFVKFGRAEPFMTSWSFIIFLIIVIIADFILRKTILGRKIYATGANVIVARINGINTDLVRISTHVFVSFLAGLSGILYASRIEVSNSIIGIGWELPVIAGAIIGGVSLLGGYGTAIGAFLGIILVQIIYNSMVLFNIRPEWQQICIGVIMIFAAGFDIWRRTRKT